MGLWKMSLSLQKGNFSFIFHRNQDCWCSKSFHYPRCLLDLPLPLDNRTATRNTTLLVGNLQRNTVFSRKCHCYWVDPTSPSQTHVSGCASLGCDGSYAPWLVSRLGCRGCSMCFSWLMFFGRWFFLIQFFFVDLRFVIQGHVMD